MLATVLAAAGGSVRDDGDGSLLVHGLTAARVGDLAFESSIRLHELAPARASLEEAFMELTAGSVEFRATVPELAAAHGRAHAGEVA
jgi:ABC-2 type transport system ATP-binding protein